jgi:hypothetical protein
MQQQQQQHICSIMLDLQDQVGSLCCSFQLRSVPSFGTQPTTQHSIARFGSLRQFPAASAALNAVNEHEPTAADSMCQLPGPSLLCSAAPLPTPVAAVDRHNACDAWLAANMSGLAPLRSHQPAASMPPWAADHRMHAVIESAVLCSRTGNHLQAHAQCPELSPSNRSTSAGTNTPSSYDSFPSVASDFGSLAVRVERSQDMHGRHAEDAARASAHHSSVRVTAQHSGSNSRIARKPAARVDMSAVAAARPCSEGMEPSRDEQSFNEREFELQAASSLTSHVEDITGGGLHATITCLSLLAAAPHSNKGKWLEGLVRLSNRCVC